MTFANTAECRAADCGKMPARRHKGGRPAGVLRLLALILTVLGIHACAPVPQIGALPAQITPGGLAASMHGIAVFAINSNGYGGLFGCTPHSVTLVQQTSGGPVTMPSVWLQFAEANVWFATLHLSAGRYSIASFLCKAGNRTTVVNAPRGEPFATFEIVPGEVRDVGVLSVGMNAVGGNIIMGPDKLYALPLVDPLPVTVRAKLRPDISAALVVRPMQPSRVVPHAEIAALCQAQRDRALFKELADKSLLCSRLTAPGGAGTASRTR